MIKKNMGLPCRSRSSAYIFLITFVLSAGLCATSSPSSNETATSLNVAKDDEAVLSEMNLAEFKERYRRLIPYMTFYVANNYVNGQIEPPRNFIKGTQSNSLSRRPQQQSATRHGSNVPANSEGNYRAPLQNGDKKFIPSVQYDPRNIGGDNDFFSPVRYGAKLAHAVYSNPYLSHQGQEAAYPEITTPSAARFPPENRYYTTVRPVRPYSASQLRDYLPRKQSARPIQVTLSNDYILDYANRPNGKTLNPPVINYPTNEYKAYGYIPSVSQDDQVVGPELPGRSHASTISAGHRKPNVNVKHLLESFRLAERLPETLNNANLDSSLRTLAEILSILHGAGKEDFPQQRIPLQPFLPAPLPAAAPPLKVPSKLSGFENFKVRYTRPKVITESRFQATPRPPFLTDDPERFTSGSAVRNEKPKTQLQSDYNGLQEEKVLDYYAPYVQDIEEGHKQVFVPAPLPQNEDISTGHSYEITEDLSDDILEDERLTSPLTTETPIPEQPVVDETPSYRPIVPQVSLKYGATRGKPNVDYPAYASIPDTKFSCKEQRYKGFFGDPETGCQVWHYCDLNGGKSSFLCPNGTIFSQVALTCDWWFNVKCESTTQLYVLNERLYKYILPIMPKFPEDFTGPEVDRYLEIKFKEMEAKLKEKKLKKQEEGKGKIKDKLQTLANDINKNVK